MFLLTCQYFGKMEKKSSCRKLGLHFTSISLLELKSYAMKVQGELPGCFFHCTMEWLQPYAPTTSFKLMALRNTVECQCYNETNIPLSSKTQQKITYLILYHVKSDWFYPIQIWTLIAILHTWEPSLRSFRSPRTLWNHDTNIKTFWLALLVFFRSRTLSRILLRLVLISI